MAIQAWENRTKVITPGGHIGRVIVTRRERVLIDSGKLKVVSVLGSDGVTRLFSLSLLQLAPEPEPKSCPCRLCRDPDFNGRP